LPNFTHHRFPDFLLKTPTLTTRPPHPVNASAAPSPGSSLRPIRYDAHRFTDAHLPAAVFHIVIRHSFVILISDFVIPPSLTKPFDTAHS
jgi:hypothetical protein